MNVEYRIVDAFASRPFQGNPAAVVLGGDGWSDRQMQQVAAEFNLSETVFVLRPERSADHPIVRLRWFTPACEVSFCGHASLAAVHAYCEESFGRSSSRPAVVGLECAAGKLAVSIDTVDGAARYWLTMPRGAVNPIDFDAQPLCDSLGLPPDSARTSDLFWTRDRDVIVFLSRGAAVRAMRPDMTKLEAVMRQQQIRGVLASSIDTGDEQVACISRFFAPASGIAEDPVTGSVHGPLATLLIQRGHVAPRSSDNWSFLCRQIPSNGRIGDVFARATGRAGGELAVEVGGGCVTVMSGTLMA
jgi:trans-2,3-dihydro-3-hydroxyanthranilate isomerase